MLRREAFERLIRCNSFLEQKLGPAGRFVFCSGKNTTRKQRGPAWQLIETNSLKRSINSCARLFYPIPRPQESTMDVPMRAVSGQTTVWREGQTLTTRFEQALEKLKDLHCRWKHRRWKLPGTYNGWTQTMVKKTAIGKKTPVSQADGFLPRVAGQLREMIAKVAPGHWRRHRWVPVAVDGTRFEAPHTEANENGLSGTGKEKTAPQVFLLGLSVQQRGTD